MNAEAVKKGFGSEYPAAVVVNSVRMQLALETRFCRYYSTGQPETGSFTVSRFRDGSASMAAEELKQEWRSWTGEQRVDFCDACAWLHDQPDFADMLHFVMLNGGPNEWTRIAQSVASHLPQDDAFLLMRDALPKVDIGHCANIIQAIGATKHPAAQETLKNHLQTVWSNPGLWRPDPWLNRIAFEAGYCIKHLIELGASPAAFEDKVRALSEHVCPRNRESCRELLSKNYSWLNTSHESHE